MHQQHGRADSVEERHQRVAVEDLLLLEIFYSGQLARDQLLHDRVLGLAAPRPLGMQVRLRPELVFFLRDVASLRILPIDLLGRPIDPGDVGRSPASGLVHDVDGVAAPHEKLRPSFAAVGSSREVGSGHGAAVHHHDRKRMRLLRRNAEFHVHLPRHVGASVDAD